jgi:hypothetical protein
MVAAAPPAVLCSDAIGHPAAPAAAGRKVVLRFVALPPYLPQTVRDDNGARFHYWSKTGLVVRSGVNVTIAVPPPWRDRAAIGWGNGATPVRSLRVAACTWMDFSWNAYAGGFFLRDRAACVPLVVHARGRTTTFRVGVGRRC